MQRPTATIIDVLENALGGIEPASAESMTHADIENLADLVNEFYRSWTAPPKDDTTITAYSATPLGHNAAGSPETSYLFSSLLYYPRVVVHDPFSSWFNRDRSELTIPVLPRLKGDELWVEATEYRLGAEYHDVKPELDEARTTMRFFLEMFAVLRPLIVEGVIVPVPAWKIVRKRQEEISAAMRHDIKDDAMFALLYQSEEAPRVSDFTHGRIMMNNIPPKYQRYETVRPASFYLNKLITIADEMDAVYVPSEPIDYALLQTRLKRVRQELKMRSADFRIVPELMKLKLPIFDEVKPKTLVAMRQNDSAFEEFRAVLADLYRSASIGGANSEEFPNEIADALRDKLIPRVNEVERATARSATLRDALQSPMLDMVVGGAGVFAAAAAHGGAALPALVGVGATGVTGSLRRLLFRQKPQGANLVISALLRGRT